MICVWFSHFNIIQRSNSSSLSFSGKIQSYWRCQVTALLFNNFPIFFTCTWFEEWMKNSWQMIQMAKKKKSIGDHSGNLVNYISYLFRFNSPTLSMRSVRSTSVSLLNKLFLIRNSQTCWRLTNLYFHFQLKMSSG